MKRIPLGIISAVVALAALPAVASASVQDKEWICHGTGSGANPYVLINVPTNSAHFTKHLTDGADKLPLKVEEGLTCGDEGSPPTPPFNGKITFALVKADCKEGEVGVPGFTVTEEQFSHGEYLTDGDGREIGEVVIFEYPSTCVPQAPGTAGPQGPAGANGVTTATTTTVVAKEKSCVSRRTVRMKLVKALWGFKRVSVRVAGHKAVTVTPNSKHQVSVSLRGLKHGQYAVIAQARTKGKLVRDRRIYTVCADGNLTKYNVP